MPLDHTEKVDMEGNLGSEQTGVSINLAKFCVTSLAADSFLVVFATRTAGAGCGGNGKKGTASSFPSHPGRF